MREPEPLRCTCCGCTDERACPGGCSWLIKHPVAVCSACAPGTRLKRALRFLAVYIATRDAIAETIDHIAGGRLKHQGKN